jgi:hypothetical protein
MPVTRAGDTSPKYGLTEEPTLGYIQEFNVDLKPEIKEYVHDHEGYRVAVALADLTYTGSFKFIAKNGSTLPVVLATQSIANLTEVSKCLIISKKREPMQKGFETHTFEYEAYERITLS